MKNVLLNLKQQIFLLIHLLVVGVITINPGCIIKISENLPFDRKTGVLLTLDWLLNERTKYNSYSEFKKLFRSICRRELCKVIFFGNCTF